MGFSFFVEQYSGTVLLDKAYCLRSQGVVGEAFESNLMRSSRVDVYTTVRNDGECVQFYIEHIYTRLQMCDAVSTVENVVDVVDELPSVPRSKSAKSLFYLILENSRLSKWNIQAAHLHHNSLVSSIHPFHRLISGRALKKGATRTSTRVPVFEGRPSRKRLA